ncbi:MarR family winged helix-turn-helix transcriptional regulator [Shimwellia blattae]|uniref:Putative transcriptional regulator, MarR family n=1 Tax=Shimwellia blattae (strain ATCC 29907 / DSM 4481 / JCM 1650 / NBRC 105725 / CDC 9005-74) TaxID=630626 RepID=I2B751_SHIBC|nr:MarR family winged helix-turn-helix transcriptional regulator [Shimwellia blattae]AFJ46355.1 putative transcriptional regulator, MarR family [Shimwellia blattae DSM 4481 = NBRC 105725]GAB79938.1 putative MarR family transcriptional regulator [Shimwellia blattae DSM 4481 = NBRC 105725]VDY63821.1 MarR family [Shimwellia blattae]VEC21959.1 MarR family [Shimwellia blattae]
MTLFDTLERLANLQMMAFYRNPQLKALPAVQIQILYYLSRCNDYSNTPGAVAGYLGLTKGTISQSLGRLERNGWLEKHGDPRDKRLVRLVPTPQARQALASALDASSLAQAQPRLPAGGAELEHQLQLLLRDIQQQQGERIYGECRYCRFHQQQDGQRHCGLTGDPLTAENSRQICREFAR